MGAAALLSGQLWRFPSRLYGSCDACLCLGNDRRARPRQHRGGSDEKLKELPRPPGYEFRFGGEYEEQVKAFNDLMFAAVLALILVYMVMAVQFESLRHPFIILFSSPLAAIGVVTMLVLTGD